MDQDLWSKALNFHGNLLLQTLIGDEVSEPKSDSERDKLQTCQFIKKRTKQLFEQSDELPNVCQAKHSIPIIPIEVFRDASLEDRRDLFYKSLDRGDILILKVINDTLPDNYKLLVLCKQENHMKLDDLSIIMFLPKLHAELELAGGKLESNDLIRAAVCSCSIDERKLYVTLDSNILEDETEKIHLGKITEKDLPFYIGEVDFGPSYVEYLNNQTSVFSNPNWSEDLHSILNLKRNYLHSFLENFDGKTYNPVVYATELRKKQILTVSDEHYTLGLEQYENKQFDEALLSYNKALDVNPTNIDALVSRGILYSNIKKDIRKAMQDLQAALNIDRRHKKASVEIAVLLVSVAKTHIKHKNIVKARDSLEAALYVDSNNKDAIAAYEALQDMDITDMSSDKSAQASGSGKKDGIASGSSPSGISKINDSIEDEESLDQVFNLDAATKKFLFSMQKKHPDHEKDKKSHRGHHKQ